MYIGNEKVGRDEMKNNVKRGWENRPGGGRVSHDVTTNRLFGIGSEHPC
jgi:hypothetical protein